MDSIKKCKSCGKDIAATAKYCPYCGSKDKSSWYKKWWVWVLIIFIFLMVIIPTEDSTEMDPNEQADTDLKIPQSKFQKDIIKKGLPEELYSICIGNIPDFTNAIYKGIETEGKMAYIIKTEDTEYSCIISPDGDKVMSVFYQSDERKNDIMYYQLINDKPISYHLCDYHLDSTTEADYTTAKTNIYRCSVCNRSYSEHIGKPKAPIEFVIISWDQDIAGGNTVLVSVKNLTNKQIKWIDFTLAFWNIKGELLKDTIRGWTHVSWYNGPVAANGGRKEWNVGTFYNGNFKGDVAPTKFIIHFEDDTEITVELSEILEKYDQPLFYYTTKQTKVLGYKYHPYYHDLSGTCIKISKNGPNNFTEMTIGEAEALYLERCPECKPY